MINSHTNKENKFILTYTCGTMIYDNYNEKVTISILKTCMSFN